MRVEKKDEVLGMKILEIEQNKVFVSSVRSKQDSHKNKQMNNNEAFRKVKIR